MNADFSSASPSEPAGSAAPPAGVPLPAGAQEPASNAPRFPTQKRRYRKPEDEIVVEDDEAEMLSEVLRKVRERKQQSETTEPAQGSTVYRFLRRGAGAPIAPNDASTPGPRAVPATPDTPAPAALVSGAAPEFKPRPPAADAVEFWNRNRLQWLQIVLSYAVVAILVLIAYVVGRNGANRASPVAGNAADAVRASQWLPADSDQLAEARSAEHAGDLNTALRITNGLAKHVKLDPALRAYRATLNTRLGHVNDVEPDLRPLLDSNPPPDVSATVNTARAFNFVRCRQFDLAFACFANVAKADPFDVSNLIHWGEALRRCGMLATAVDKFQEALVRLPVNASPYVEAQREYIAYESRLSQVEAGLGAALEPEIEQHLSAPAPPGYWLLTAAASALQNGNLPEAVDALRKAQVVLPPEQFNSLLRDDFFHSFAFHPELSAFPLSVLPKEGQARRLTMDYFVDK